MEIEQQRSQYIVQYFTQKGIDSSRIKGSDKIVYSEDLLLPGPVFNITYLVGEEDTPPAEET